MTFQVEQQSLDRGWPTQHRSGGGIRGLPAVFTKHHNGLHEGRARSLTRPRCPGARSQEWSISSRNRGPNSTLSYLLTASSGAIASIHLYSIPFATRSAVFWPSRR